MKLSTLIIRIEEITSDKITYTSKGDIFPRDYNHIIPTNSNFPFNELKLRGHYALISARPDTTWYWWIAYNLEDTQVLKDKNLAM